MEESVETNVRAPSNSRWLWNEQDETVFVQHAQRGFDEDQACSRESSRSREWSPYLVESAADQTGSLCARR